MPSYTAPLKGFPGRQREVLTFRLTADETTAATAATGKSYARFPFSLVVTDCRLMAVTAPTGAALIADIRAGGTTIFSTLPRMDISAKTSVGSAVPFVLTTNPTIIPADTELRADITQIGSTVAGAGVRLYLIGYFSPQ